MIPRCSFFFENPNMASVLFVQLALAGRCALARWPRLGRTVVFLSALAVVLTGSRGGLVALAAGLLVCAFASPRRNASRPRQPAPGRGARAVSALAVLALAATLVLGGLGGRFLSIPHDGSVANRLLLWRAVPRMMADAPGGWGRGRSGAAYVDWYQPLDRHEEYRTMVGSHQTALVEFGTAGRVLYLFGWLLALALAFRRARRTGDAHAAAQGTALAVAASFSSVLEVWTLWILPLAAALPVVRDLARSRPRAGLWASLAAGALAPILLVALCCASGDRRFEDSGRISRATGADTAGATWLVPDERVLGAHWPRLVRAHAPRLSTAATLGLVPPDAGELIVCGAPARLGRDRFPHVRRIIHLSPRFRPLACDPTFERIAIGEFAPDVPDPAPDGVTVVPGHADYLGDGFRSLVP